jgi:hypothetical protein
VFTDEHVQRGPRQTAMVGMPACWARICAESLCQAFAQTSAEDLP